MTESGLFELEAVVVRQPERSSWRRYVGPVLAVSTVEETPLAQVTHTGDTHFLLAKASGECIVRIKRRSRFGQFGPVRFHFADSADQEVGTAVAHGVMQSLRLTLQTEQGRQLFLTRRGLLSGEWLLTETDPKQSPVPETLGRVTVSSVNRWRGWQRYVVETNSSLNASERRTVVASVVCLHLLRRPPGDSAAPA